MNWLLSNEANTHFIVKIAMFMRINSQLHDVYFVFEECMREKRDTGYEFQKSNLWFDTQRYMFMGRRSNLSLKKLSIIKWYYVHIRQRIFTIIYNIQIFCRLSYILQSQLQGFRHAEHYFIKPLNIIRKCNINIIWNV